MTRISANKATTVKPTAPVDSRLLHRSIRMSGAVDETSGIFQSGELLVDVSRVQELLDAHELDVQALLEQGVISGNWSS